MELNSSITNIKGIGDKKLRLYEKLGISTLDDLISFYPRTYIDYSKPVFIGEIDTLEPVTIRVKILNKNSPMRISGGRVIYKATAEDELGGKITLTYFNNQYALQYLNVGEIYLFNGKINSLTGPKEMVAPTHISENDKNLLKPIYNQTAGLTSYGIAKDVKEALSLVSDKIVETFPQELRDEYKLCHLMYAVEKIHFPPSEFELAVARRRLAFEELLCFQLALQKLKSDVQIKTDKKMEPFSLKPFYKELPFKLTEGQNEAITAGIEDMSSGKIMNRLIQGDVGSGKTMVAAALSYIAIKNGYQVALMSPTEILARQHYNTFNELFSRFGMKCELLVGGLKAKERRIANENILSGETNIVIGTHAIFSDTTEFKNLGLVITDEQHRFGVEQRAKLASKGTDVHMLVMSATPIPRTLALILYGDLDISIIKEMPKGRKTVQTMLIDGKKRERALGFVLDHVKNGDQAYIVCPLVEPGEDITGLFSAEEYGEKLKNSIFKSEKLEILHGQMKASEKEKIMSQFANGEISVLVTTTVIEVGVDVSNATIMMIENAERFGLSQLHQLRGRVGRGDKDSFCILVTDSRTEKTLKRLSTLKNNSDGFKLAEEDLKMRGPGDFFGNRQHGTPMFKMSDFFGDSILVAETAHAVKTIIDKKSLQKNDYKFIVKKVDKFYNRAVEYSYN